MGRFTLIGRLVRRDMRRRPGHAALLLVALMAATTTLALGLALRGTISQPYEATKEATNGPDVVASVAPNMETGEPADIDAVNDLTEADGVVDHSGPFPYARTEVQVNGYSGGAWAQGRSEGTAAVDQPEVTEGTWVGPGEVVVEASFAKAVGIQIGDQITIGDGQSFKVVGFAVSVAAGEYPKTGFAPFKFASDEPESARDVGLAEELWNNFTGLWSGDDAEEGGAEARAPESSGSVTESKAPPPAEGSEEFRSGGKPENPPRPGAFGERVPGMAAGLIWLTESDARSLVPAKSLGYVVNLKLDDPDGALVFVDMHREPGSRTQSFAAWQELRDYSSWLAETKKETLLLGSWLLIPLALASIAMIVGSRMAEQRRRIGLLKAVGGTPGLVTAVLLAEYVAVALIATAFGVSIGQLVAPWFVDLAAGGLLGGSTTPPLSLSTVGIVGITALGTAGAAALLPARRAARASTADALAGSVRSPRRRGRLITASARLPVSLMLGMRLALRRPRRSVLGVVTVVVAVSGIVAALAVYNNRATEAETITADPRMAVLQAWQVLSVALGFQLLITTACIVWANVLDTRRPSALARTLGATPAQAVAGLSIAQLLPALLGAVLGIYGGHGLFRLLDEDSTSVPLWQLAVVVAGCLVMVAVLTIIPARLSAQARPGKILQADPA